MSRGTTGSFLRVPSSSATVAACPVADALPQRSAEQTGGERINTALREHQTTVKDWRRGEAVRDLHTWAERFIVEFKLETGPPALMFDRLRSRLGHYRSGRNPFGLRDEIAIDVRHLTEHPYWQVLGTLLHECVHCWQEHNGAPAASSAWNYHNREFREKARSLGLIVDRYGYTTYAAGDTPFFTILRKYQLNPPDAPPEVPPPLSKGHSKLHLFVCPCGVRARVGRRRFNARCLDCGGLFQPGA